MRQVISVLLHSSFNRTVFSKISSCKPKNIPTGSFYRYASSKIERIPSALVLVEHKDGIVLPATWCALAAAGKLKNHSISFVAISSNVANVGEKVDETKPELLPSSILDALKAHSPKEILVLSSPLLPEPLAPLLANILSERPFTHLVASSSAFARSLLPRIGALIDVAPVADVIEIKAPDVFVRPIYAGNAICTISSKQMPNIIAVRPTSFQINEGKSVKSFSAPVLLVGEAKKEHMELSELLSEDLVKSERPDLSSAKVVIAGGRALKSAENFKMLYDLADKLGGTVGASRAAVDAGYVDNSLQIGQTGKVIAPSLYIGVGISGAIQHIAGMKGAKVIVAINNDPEAPIFQIADYGLVANLFEAVPELTKKL